MARDLAARRAMLCTESAMQRVLLRHQAMDMVPPKLTTALSLLRLLRMLLRRR